MNARATAERRPLGAAKDNRGQELGQRRPEGTYRPQGRVALANARFHHSIASEAAALSESILLADA